jgi:phosphatidylinositol glycan class B
VLLWVALWVVAVYSTQPHKEFRFVLLTLPLFAVYAGRGLAFLDASSSSSSNPAATASEGRRRRKPSRSRSPSPSKGGGKKPKGELSALPETLIRARASVPHQLLLAAMVLLNAPLAYYFGRLHQAGPVSAIWHLADEADRLVAAGGDSGAMSVLFLMPCHSTPWHASLHPHRLQLRQLDCSPPPPPPPGELEAPHETARFYADPEGVAGALLDADRTGITHVAMFGDMAARLRPALERRGFGYGGAAARFFHAHLIDDDRASAELVVVCRGAVSAGE